MKLRPSPSTDSPNRLDPVFVDARREAIQILMAWVAALLWTVGFCWFLAYRRPGDGFSPATIGGVPSWVFWGVVLPWIASALWTWYYSLFVMTDNSLGEDESPSESGD